MHLKRIELENFKSFMGELVIDLEEGFTAITGPNGSGKSNSGDAIQFVLGTRSTKSLRAQNVKELIFNGGSRSKAAKSCQVTLIFDNPANNSGERRLKVDADEVCFTRAVRVTPKGAAVSAYRLNDRPSTSTEFRRLLIEAGARGDGYNIVLQGDVASLSTMTPLERRRVLEDVAGVTQYDEELRKADRQRKQVESQLEMIDVFEKGQVERIESLEKEREKALKYRELMEELETSRSLLMQSKHRSQFEEIRMLGEERTRYISSSDELKDSCEKSELRFQHLDDEIVRIQREMEALLGSSERGTLERIRRLEIDIEAAGDRILELNNASERALVEAKTLEKEIDQAKASIEKHLSGIKDAETQLEAAKLDMKNAESDESEARKAMEQGDKATMDLNRAYGKAVTEATKLSDRFQVQTLETERARQSADIAHGQVADLQDSHRDAEMEVADLEMEIEESGGVDSGEERTRLGQELVRLQKAENTLRQEELDARNARNEAERQLVRARQEMEQKSGRSSHQAQAVKSICGIRDRAEIDGILGPLSELCAPKDDAHSLALSHALGGGMNHIVVRDDEVASVCIRRLKEGRLGRAVFLPLNKMQVRRSGGRALMVSRQTGVVGFAADLLDFDPQIENAVRTAVRDTLIVQNMDVARGNMGGVRMVTLDGTVFEASGAMVGGVSRSPSASFGGGKALGLSIVEKASSSLESAEILHMTVQSAVEKNQESQQEIRTRINSLTQEDGSMRARELKGDHDRARSRLAEIKKRLNHAESELKKKAKEVETAETANAKAEAEQLAAVSNRDELMDRLRSQTPEHLSNRLRNAQESYTEASRQSIQAESALTTGNERLEIIRSEIKKLEERQSESISVSKNNAEQIQDLESNREDWAEELDGLREIHSQVSEEHKALDDQRTEYLEERATLRANLETMNSKRITMMARITELNSEIDRKHAVLKELSAEMADMNISIPEEGDSIPAFTEVESKVRSLERRISQIGNVNQLAIEQYDEAAARVEQLRQDASSLRDRRSRLIEIADQLESERRLRLTEVLNKVSTNFSRVYKLLQPGGKGDLRLENPKDPFSGGLEMWAMPPGKSSQTRLNLLSGGEKSMAALALIFAIQDFEPSPFYYFDEVDQNLDSFNAESIAKLCRLRSGRAQFIMVTLRKVSLQMADHHIGVTHGGDGCSRLIMNFDRDAAVEMGEAAEAELEAQKKAEEERANMPELPIPQNRPMVPDPLPNPESLGGIREEGDLEVQDSEGEEDPSSLVLLGDRAADAKEDLEERLDWEARLEEAEAEEVENKSPKQSVEDEQLLEE